jgi:hypothetical protein
MWEPQCFTTLWASTACYRDSLYKNQCLLYLCGHCFVMLDICDIRYFRVIPASVFLQHFASDRRHMKRADGSWIKPPPDYPPITTPGMLQYL